MTMFRVGSDPEVFVKVNAGEQYVSAHGMIDGTKKAPLKVKNGAVQVDGMALEFNIDPADSREQFINNINLVKQQLHEMIGMDRYNLVAIPHVVFSENVWKETPEEAKELGCDPDFNAWKGGKANARPDNTTKMRTGAGHVHIGWGEGFNINDPDHVEACIMLTKQLDCSLGLASLHWDDDNKRRELYGKAGAFRPKPYGSEYRVLSNAWLKSEELTGYVYQATIHAAEDLARGIRYFEKHPYKYCAEYINYGVDPYYRKEARKMTESLNKAYGFPIL